MVKFDLKRGEEVACRREVAYKEGARRRDYLNEILPHLGQKSKICQQQFCFTDFLPFEYVYNMSIIRGCSFLQCSPDHWSAVHR